MTLKHIEEYRDSQIAKKLINEIITTSRRPIRLMEVCGTHTVSIFRSGIRFLLPKTIVLLSGPGCPVCVTDQREIDAFIELARMDDVIVTTFGDLMRVPGSNSSLQKESAEVHDIRVVYSTFDALEVAQKNPDKKVVFLGVGFETTAPTIAASIMQAAQMKVDNYSVISAHKLVPPALDTLMSLDDVQLDACWRGIGMIPLSGLKIRDEFAVHDAVKQFDIRMPEPQILKGCACGEILTGKKSPPDCKLYKKVCTPTDPVGPCMVSTEGTCAAYYRYHI